MNLNDVKNLNQKRMIAEASLEEKNIGNLIEEAVRKEVRLPRLNEAEELVFKIRTELIDYIIEHGLVQGFEFDGNDYPIQNGKIVITKEMIKMVTDKFNYLDESEAEEFINQIMDEQFVVRDKNYVHTDNNFTDEDLNKLNGIEEGAEVNKVVNVTVDGETVLDNSDRVAKITKEIIKDAYESNENTNAFTDAEKTKLAGISDGAETNRVDDVLVNGRSVLNEQKQAVITKEIIKEAYESNENTNAFTDAEKEKLQELGTWQGQIDGELETLNNDLEELGNTVNQNSTNLEKLKGGTEDQVLTKKSGNDYDFKWVDQQKEILKIDQYAYKDITTHTGAGNKFQYKTIEINNILFVYFNLFGLHDPVADYEIDPTDLIDESKEVIEITQNAQICIFNKENASEHGETLYIYTRTNAGKIVISFYCSDSSSAILAQGCGLFVIPLRNK